MKLPLFFFHSAFLPKKVRDLIDKMGSDGVFRKPLSNEDFANILNQTIGDGDS